ncbi:SDR family NAD(P)-dependent oxidoreductase [Roseobacteraceae bacterium NS-SX3]
MLAGQRWWIIGASEGLGRALAKALDAEGVSLVVSARSIGRLEDLAQQLRSASPVPMDVTCPQSVAQAVAEAGEIDAVLYCADAYEPLRAQDWRPDAAETMCEVNFTGALRVLGRVVPRFVQKGRGRIVLIGSLAGFAGLPGAIGYGASKAALMHLGENLHADLLNSGVTVQVINPGFIETRLTRKNDFRMPMIQPPGQAAAACLKAVKSGRFRTSFPAPFSWLFLLGRILPHGLFARLMGAGR